MRGRSRRDRGAVGARRALVPLNTAARVGRARCTVPPASAGPARAGRTLIARETIVDRRRADNAAGLRQITRVALLSLY